jgi:small-conductance mechanosensitive channel
VAIVLGAIVASILTTRALKLLAARTEFTDEGLAPFRKLLRWLIILGAAIVLLGIFGLNLSGLWAMLATIVGMVAIGFVAVWSVLSNVLCTVAILLFRPCSIGDQVEFVGEAVKGRVIDLNFMFTTLLAEDGGWLEIPNNLFFQKTVKRWHNHAGVSLAQQLGARRAVQL